MLQGMSLVDMGYSEIALKENKMEPQFRSRNHDMGTFFPTFQERVNTMMPVQQNTQAAPNLAPATKAGMTPHYPTTEEVAETLAQVEAVAAQQSEELIQMHSGLNEERVARLLGMLD